MSTTHVNPEEYGNRQEDQKAGVSERRKRQMVWCEDQRYKLQKKYDTLQEAKNAVDKLLDRVLQESAELLKMRRNVLDQLKDGRGMAPIPEGTFAPTSEDLFGNFSDSSESDGTPDE